MPSDILSTYAATNTSQSSAANKDLAANRAYRDTDFMKIMLAELSHQDPMAPMETSKIVEGMQKLQDLANSKYEKFRADVRWGDELVGKSVTVGQTSVTEKAAQALANKGLRLDTGAGVVNGTIEGYQVVDETVWVTVKGKDYPLDNVQKIQPKTFDRGNAIEQTSGMLGNKVTWFDAGAKKELSAIVSKVSWDDSGLVTLTVGTGTNAKEIALDKISSISKP
jgi:hypothetical protein